MVSRLHRLSRLHLQRMEAMWHPSKKASKSKHQVVEEKSLEDNDVEHCLRLVMMDLNPPSDALEEAKLAEATADPFHRTTKEKYKSAGLYHSVGKHNPKKCAKCTRLYYIVNFLVEGCLTALVKQSLEHVDLLITKMELKGVTDRATFHQYLQHGLTLSEKVESFYQRQDQMCNAFKVCARMRHSKTAQDLIKQGFELLNEMRVLNNKYQVSIDNFCNLMAENAGVPVE